VQFLNKLPAASQNHLSKEKTEFYVHKTYTLRESLVFAGTVIKGTIKKDQVLYMGPFKDSSF
jgi:GTPase